ncbi:MAG: TIGR03557 family F420-dependent LLM class oxidoreductase [Actinomycetota bacterium]|nr:TIGR03557 family F420-dependent LLM class oxidoreductase [Actinomycetota bacterium]
MAEIGYTLSAEEHGPRDLVRFARRAEETGFDFLMVSDHYHPWTERQGQSPFVWTVLGGVAEATERIPIGTGVTCPTIRIHPAIVAQAAATAAEMLPGRFWLGLGSGENLNEHVVGARWPSARIRLEMLEEAIEVIRMLWEGGFQSFRGTYYEIENARIYTLPEELPPILVAASGSTSIGIAAGLGDGMIGTSPDKELLERFAAAGGEGKPTVGQLHVCWAETVDEGRRTAFEWWPNTSLPGELGQELPLPRHFEQATQTLTIDDVAQTVPSGPDPERHLEEIRKFVDAGYDRVYVHQVGPDQEGFFRFYEQQVLPKLR